MLQSGAHGLNLRAKVSLKRTALQAVFSHVYLPQLGLKILHPLQLCGAQTGTLKQGAVVADVKTYIQDLIGGRPVLFCTEVLLFLAFLGSISKVCLTWC